MLIANFVSLLKENQLVERLKPGVAGKGGRGLYPSPLHPCHQGRT